MSSRQSAYQRRHLKLGLCSKCPEKRVTAIFCLYHAVLAREAQRKRRGTIAIHSSITRKLEKQFAPPPLKNLSRE